MKIGIIGGSGLEDLNIFADAKEVEISTPFGSTSSTLITGKIHDKEVVIISRHGRQHTITPTNVNNRANIWALQNMGCSYIIATTACGSLKEEIGRGHLVFPDQFIDFTRHRAVTFFDTFENGNLKHTPMANPFSDKLCEIFIDCATKLKLAHHTKGTVITIEGPRFSTRSESLMFRSWGADIINMSTAPECILANELEIPYAAIALSTDYDCWKIDEQPVSWEEILKVFKQNVDNVIRLLVEIINKIQ